MEKPLEQKHKTVKKVMSKHYQKTRLVTVGVNSEGQRIDNFLLKEIKNVPRSYIYRILRKGEVRVNKKRAKPILKLVQGDVVRIPPVFLEPLAEKSKASKLLLKTLEESILLEDEDIILINKPSGLAVHGGTGQKYGLIESFRQLRPNMPFVELVHRLDKETSGIVMLAKNRPILLELHDMLKEKRVNKHYQTLVFGKWQGGVQQVTNQLQRQQHKHQKMKVVADSKEHQGKKAESIFYPLKSYKFQDKCYSLLEVELLTGRMHQIRTQLADRGYPIISDSQYGDFSENRFAKKQLGARRLFLHAFHVHFQLQSNGKRYDCKIPFPDDLQQIIKKLANE